MGHQCSGPPPPRKPTGVLHNKVWSTLITLFSLWTVNLIIHHKGQKFLDSYFHVQTHKYFSNSSYTKRQLSLLLIYWERFRLPLSSKLLISIWSKGTCLWIDHKSKLISKKPQREGKVNNFLITNILWKNCLDATLNDFAKETWLQTNHSSWVYIG